MAESVTQVQPLSCPYANVNQMTMCITVCMLVKPVYKTEINCENYTETEQLVLLLKFFSQDSYTFCKLLILRVSCFQVLLSNGADVNATFASLNTTALMTSAFHGHVDVVRLLLDSGANVRALDRQQSTALGYCFGGR